MIDNMKIKITLNPKLVFYPLETKSLNRRFYVELNYKRYIIHPTKNTIYREREEPKNQEHEMNSFMIQD